MPITGWQAIVGKFFSAWLVLLIALGLTFPIAVTVGRLGHPDYGVIIAGYIGSALIAGTYLAVSMATSAMTRNQVVSFVMSVVLCLFLLLAGWPPVTNMLVNWAPYWLVDGVAACSVIPYFESLQKGVLDMRGVAYFVSIMVFGLFAAAVILRNRRTR